MISVEKLKRLFHYNPDTGIFTKIASGKTCGSNVGNGYKRIMIDGEKYFVHRLAWLYEHGHFPKQFIDHINGIRGDNRIANLRAATRSENLRNVGARKDNKLGVKGVHYDTRRKAYIVQLVVDGKQKKIGRFTSIDQAEEAYQVAASMHYGRFMPTNLAAAQPA